VFQSARGRAKRGKILLPRGEQAAPPPPPPPGGGKGAGGGGQQRDKQIAATSAAHSLCPSEGKGWGEGLKRTRLHRF